jgi:hypothetical protein
MARRVPKRYCRFRAARGGAGRGLTIVNMRQACSFGAHNPSRLRLTDRRRWAANKLGGQHRTRPSTAKASCRAARARAACCNARLRVEPRGNTAKCRPTVTSPRHALREIAAGAVDRIRLRQRLLKLQSDDVEEDHEPDGQIGMTPPRASWLRRRDRRRRCRHGLLPSGG